MVRRSREVNRMHVRTECMVNNWGAGKVIIILSSIFGSLSARSLCGERRCGGGKGGKKSVCFIF